MKKIHILGVAVVAMLAFGVFGPLSASAATLQWLAEGKAITVALAAEVSGELLFEMLNFGNLTIHTAVLCSGIFDGTVGPGAEDNISELLTLTDIQVTLASPILNCAIDSNCEKLENPEVSAANLPWLTRLELMGTEAAPLFLDVLEPGNGLVGAEGNPGWEIACLVLGMLITEVCTSANISSNLLNDVIEKDVLARFENALANCSLGGVNQGLVETSLTDSPADEEGLIRLSGGNTEALSVSYE